MEKNENGKKYIWAHVGVMKWGNVKMDEWEEEEMEDKRGNGLRI
jgi:hypothetical protein